MADVFDPTINRNFGRKNQTEEQTSDVFDPTIGRAHAVEEPQGNFVQRTIKAISGEGRKDPNIPELTTAKGLPWKLAGGMIASTSPEQQLDVVRQNVPGAKFTKDQFGNDVVEVPGQGQFYINKPGLSQQDVLGALGQGVAYLGAARTGGKPFQSLLGKAAGVGAASGATSVGLDVASQAAGSEQGIDLPRAGVTAAGGAIFEMAAPVFNSVGRWLTRGGKIPTAVEARAALQKLGYKPEELTDEAIASFITKARDAANPGAAAALAEADTLPVRVPLKRGQISGRAGDQMFEDLAEKGAYGESAETIMRGASQRTEEALRNNIPAIQQRIGGGVVGQRGQGAAMAQQRLVRMADDASAGVDAAYDMARSTSGNLPANASRTMMDDVARSIDDFGPSAEQAVAELASLRDIVSKLEPSSTFGMQRAPADIAKLFDWRRKVTNLAQNAKDRTNAKALRNMVTQFDNSMDEAIKNTLMSGDSEAVKAWQKAINLRKSKGQKFESGDLISDLVETEFTGGGVRLKVSPEAASNYIFGSSNTGFIARPQLARELKRMKSVLGPRSEEWNAVREEAFLRLADQAKGAFQGGKRGFSGVGFKKAVDDLQRKNPEVWVSLFDEPERKLINQFANVAARATNPVKGGANTSNTAVGLSRMVQSVGNALFMGEKGRAVLSRIVPVGYEGLQMGRAAQAARGALPLRQLPAGTAGGIGAALTSEETR